MPNIIYEDKLLIPAEVDSISTFRTWTHSDSFPSDVRIDFVMGRILIEMSPEELFTHGRVKSEVNRVLGNLVHEDRNLMLFTDSTRIAKNDAELSSEPDVVVVSRQRIRNGELNLIRKTRQSNRYIEIEGGPDIAVEVVSDSSVTKDKQLLPNAHYQAGTLEYWLIDVRDETKIEFWIHRRGDNGWIVDRDSAQHSGVLQADFRLTTHLDEDDWLECNLEVIKP